MVGRTGNSRTLTKIQQKRKKSQNNQTHTYTKEKPGDTLTRNQMWLEKKKGIVLQKLQMGKKKEETQLNKPLLKTVFCVLEIFRIVE